MRYVRAGHAKNVNNAKGMLFQCVFSLTTFSCVLDSFLHFDLTHFRVQSIKASFVSIACKMAKLFAFFH